MKYEEFLQSKRHSVGEFGFEAKFIPDIAFDFQRHVIERAVAKGRVAVFLDTGLGKTLIAAVVCSINLELVSSSLLFLACC